MGIDDIETIRKTYENKIIATHLRDDTRDKLKKKCLKDVIIKEDGTEIDIWKKLNNMLKYKLSQVNTIYINYILTK